MAENSVGSPVFADRYRFQTVGTAWDRGRSGFTHLVFDIKKERLGVIKRAEIKSQEAVDELKNEVAALLDMKGLGVPDVYYTGEAEYGSKNYFYMVTEYIEGIRIEKNIDSLSTIERTDILTQFFELLANAHRLGIVNGDVDLKHLFWRRDKKKLIVIDWGNARLDVDSKKKTEFAYDLARSAEIIYSLVTLKGHPSATGSLALPKESLLVPGLAPLPTAFHTLCKWAPRTPAEGAQSPHTAQELFETSKEWQKAVYSAKPYKPKKRPNWGLRLLFALIIIAVVFLGITSPISPLYPLLHAQTPTPMVVASDTTMPPTTGVTAAPSETPLPTATLADVSTPTIEPTFTVTEVSPTTTAVTPVPISYTNPLLVFEKGSTVPDKCWTNDPKLGFDKREDGNWRFAVEKGTPVNQTVQTDFSKCVEISKVKAIAMNVWIPRLELERVKPEVEAGKEFGLFIVAADGHRREYTIWVDANNSMHLQIREDGQVTFNELVLIVNEENLKIKGSFPRFYAEFPIQIFFEINNNGLDIIYLRQGAIQKAVKVDEIDPSQMLPIINNTVRPNLGDLQSIGLIGYGGETQTVIWPLVFFGE
jgi:serine/threonine protein kinase